MIWFQKYNSIPVLIFATFLLSNCKSDYESYQHEKGKFIRKVVTNRGHFVEIQELGNDSIPNGESKLYTNGDLTYFGTMIKGKKNGPWIFYGIGKDTMDIENWCNGHKWGVQTTYFPKVRNAKKEVYRFYFCDTSANSGNKPYCEIFFDKNENVAYIKGVPILIDSRKSLLSTSDPSQKSVFFGVPYSCRFNLDFKEMEVDRHQIKIHKIICQLNDSSLIHTFYGERFQFGIGNKSKGNLLWIISLKEWANSNKPFIDFTDTLLSKVQ